MSVCVHVCVCVCVCVCVNVCMCVYRYDISLSNSFFNFSFGYETLNNSPNVIVINYRFYDQIEPPIDTIIVLYVKTIKIFVNG